MLATVEKLADNDNMARRPNYTPDEKRQIASNLRAWREASGLTQAKVAERIGSQVTTISRYETGASSPDSGAAAKLSALFGYSVEDLKAEHPKQRARKMTLADGERIAEAVNSGELDVVEVDGKTFYVPRGLTTAQLASLAAQLKKK